MDILDALDEIKAYNERHERVDRAELGSAQKPADEMSAKERDEMAAFKRAQAARAVDAKPPPLQGSSSDEAVPAPPPTLAAPEPARPPSPPAPVVLKRRLADAPPPVEKKPKMGGLVAYSSSSSSEGEGGFVRLCLLLPAAAVDAVGAGRRRGSNGAPATFHFAWVHPRCWCGAGHRPNSGSRPKLQRPGPKNHALPRKKSQNSRLVSAFCSGNHSDTVSVRV